MPARSLEWAPRLTRRTSCPPAASLRARRGPTWPAPKTTCSGSGELMGETPASRVRRGRSTVQRPRGEARPPSPGLSPAEGGGEEETRSEARPPLPGPRPAEGGGEEETRSAGALRQAAADGDGGRSAR